MSAIHSVGKIIQTLVAEFGSIIVELLTGSIDSLERVVDFEISLFEFLLTVLDVVLETHLGL